MIRDWAVVSALRVSAAASGCVLLADAATRVGWITDPTAGEIVARIGGVLYWYVAAVLILLSLLLRTRVPGPQDISTESQQPVAAPGRPPVVLAWGTVSTIALFLLIGPITALYMNYRASLKPVWAETFQVTAGKDAKLGAIPVRKGSHLDLKLTVVAGDPVTVYLGKGFEESPGKALILEGDLPRGERVTSFTLEHFEWPHDSKAIAVVASEGRSEVAVEARVK